MSVPLKVSLQSCLTAITQCIKKLGLVHLVSLSKYDNNIGCRVYKEVIVIEHRISAMNKAKETRGSRGL